MKRLTYTVVTVFSLLSVMKASATSDCDDLLSKLDVKKIVVQEAERVSFPPELALAVARVESGFMPCAISRAGAVGVMQLLPTTARHEFGLQYDELFYTRLNINTGIRYLKNLHARYGRLDISLSHYHGGAGVRLGDGTLRVIPGTRNYVNRVLHYARYYSRSPLITKVDWTRYHSYLHPEAPVSYPVESWRASSEHFSHKYSGKYYALKQRDRARRDAVRRWERIYH